MATGTIKKQITEVITAGKSESNVNAPVGESGHTINIAKDGYDVLGVGLYAVYGASDVIITRMIIEQPGVLSYNLRNYNSTAQTVIPYFMVIYKR